MNSLTNLPPFIITLDTDWAPDPVIDFTANILIKNNVKATWFITHRSPAIERLEEHPELFELGAHPNFFPESSHGKNPEEVWETIRKIVPQAKGIRTHGLFQSTRYYIEAINRGFIYDASTLLPFHPAPYPVFFKWEEKQILKIPFVWEDDVCFSSTKDYHFEVKKQLSIPSVLSFHPIHIYLNTSSVEEYIQWKKIPDSLKYSHNNFIKNEQTPGTRTAFIQAIEMCKEKSMKLIDWAMIAC
jgi:hypothetical protein